MFIRAGGRGHEHAQRDDRAPCGGPQEALCAGRLEPQVVVMTFSQMSLMIFSTSVHGASAHKYSSPTTMRADPPAIRTVPGRAGPAATAARRAAPITRRPRRNHVQERRRLPPPQRAISDQQGPARVHLGDAQRDEHTTVELPRSPARRHGDERIGEALLPRRHCCPGRKVLPGYSTVSALLHVHCSIETSQVFILNTLSGHMSHQNGCYYFEVLN